MDGLINEAFSDQLQVWCVYFSRQLDRAGAAAGEVRPAECGRDFVTWRGFVDVITVPNRREIRRLLLA